MAGYTGLAAGVTAPVVLWRPPSAPCGHGVCVSLPWVGGAVRSCIVLAGRSHAGKATPMLASTPRAHVLVINDAQAMIADLPSLLAEAGYRISHSGTSLDCPQIKLLMPDLVVHDLVPAGVREPCWQFLSQVRLDPDLIHIPLILCPVASEVFINPIMDSNLDHLGVRVLRRPFTFNDLLRTVSEVLPVWSDVSKVGRPGRRQEGQDLVVRLGQGGTGALNTRRV